MSFVFSLAVIGVAIAIFIIRGNYKSEQTKGRRTALLALSITQSVLALYTVISSLIMIPLYAVIGFVGDIFADEHPTPDIEMFGLTFGTIMAALIILKLAMIALGTISLIMGYSAVGNRQWTNNAMDNYRLTNPQQFKTCAGCGLVVGYAQNRCNHCGSVQFFKYSPMQADVTQTPPPPAEEKRCECGELIAPDDVFCSNCGKKL